MDQQRLCREQYILVKGHNERALDHNQHYQFDKVGLDGRQADKSNIGRGVEMASIEKRGHPAPENPGERHQRIPDQSGR